MSEPKVSVVIIGRNGGSRLKRCIESVLAMRQPNGGMEVFYVDSSSTDGSADIARALGVTTLIVKPPISTASVGRNAGWKAAKGEFIFFLDGDTVVDPNFVVDTLPDFVDEGVAVICGIRREEYPDASPYNRALDLDWIWSFGPVEYCGGDALIRRSVLEEVGGYDETLIAGEEPDMCWKIRNKGYIVLHVDRPMTLHDLAMTHFSQYWNRCFRTGYAYAEISQRYKNSDDPLWLRRAHYNLLKGSGLLFIFFFSLAGIVMLGTLAPLFFFFCLIGFMVFRTALLADRFTKDLRTRIFFALHAHFQHIPMFFGQMSYWRNHFSA
ncbi:MAG: glycosyltransferase [Chlamydiales bacterium]|nr:glycosyltransferase [Chlamydiia bacterium]MCP5507946.1 glycosyltransferase [Chlamydiales bacterium]